MSSSSGSAADPRSGPPSSTPSGSAAISSPTPGLPSIPKYELLEEIGHGGMATVYKARDPRLNRDVAVKVIHRHLRENAEVATRFVAEARAAAKLRHPGIVEVYDVSNEEDSERFLIVELLRGTTLRKVLAAHREMPAEIGAAIVYQVCGAIEHAHESGIIHRDIKPENVLVELPADRERDRAATSSKPTPMSEPTEVDMSPPFARAANDPGEAISDTQQSIRDEVIPHGTHADKKPKESRSAPRSNPDGTRKNKQADLGVVIKITDFGIAKILDAQGVTSTGQVLGSPAHMAPEQIEGGDVDARTDVFALGVLMYECLVGHLPFEGKNPAQVLRKVLDGIYAPADRERPTVGGRWAKILAKALARDAADRIATPGTLAEQIAAELAAVGITDAKAEVSKYFADPKGYTETLHDRLVPKLLARGELARKGGDVPKAAADFNRALALRPTDLAILKRVGSLATTANRRVMLKRGALVLGATVIAGSVAFGVARFFKRPTLGPDVTGNAAAQDPAPILNEDPTRVPSLPTSAYVSPRETGRVRADPRIKVVAPPVLAPSSAADAGAALPGGMKKVTFNVQPKAARLFIDSKPFEFAGAVLPLPPGRHAARVVYDGSCCKSPLERGFTVDPDRDEQSFTFSLDLNPATIDVRGPVGGKYICTNNMAGATPSTNTLRMSNVVQEGVHCTLTPPDGGKTRTVTVTISAGATTVIDFGR